MDRFVNALPLGLLAACCSLPALAQIDCSAGAAGVNPVPVQIGAGLANSRLNPQISQRHVFCGEVNAAGVATGFHSRPNSHDPLLGAAPGAPFAARITAGVHYIVQPGINHPGPYRYLGRGIQVANAAGVMVPKAAPSTFFPDSCSQVQVIASIRYAYTHPFKDVGPFVPPPPPGGPARPPYANFFAGPSAPSIGAVGYCTAEGGNPFTVGGYIKQVAGLWTLSTVYPIASF
ncbi:EndoU domain-containing protein [Metapseudomonas otitidis]|uniref:EndoU domain-containing protein n=1 Tax=Metapseudomonas otitidis TaxID=319939 RepID=UPI001F461558|nr:EndoU domain-containing protein [Pseudomonas otitidis]